MIGSGLRSPHGPGAERLLEEHHHATHRANGLARRRRYADFARDNPLPKRENMKAAMKNARGALQLLLLCCLISTMSAAGAEKTAGPTQEKPETLQEPGSVVKVHQRPRKREYTLITDKGFHIKVTLCRKDVVRIQAAEKGVFADPRNNPEKAQIVVDHISRAGDVKVVSNKDLVEFATDAIILRIDKKTCQLELLDKNRKSICRELKPLQIGEKKTVQTLSTGIDEFYYGGGQQNGYFSHKGTKISIRADGKLVFESPNQTGKSVKQLMDLNVKGVKTLRLVLLDGGDGSKDDHGDWIDARLILKGSK